MTIKLTLRIDKEIVKKAKRVAELRGTSVSKLIEGFISSLPEKDESEETAVDMIKKIMNGKITNSNVDWRKAKEEHLIRKYCSEEN